MRKEIDRNIAIYYHVMGKGGVQRVISLLIPIYMEYGYKVVLITEEEKQSTDYDIPECVNRYVLENKDRTIRAQQLEKILKEEEIDILCHHNALSLLLAEDFFVVKKCNVSFVLCKHQVFTHELTLFQNYYNRQKDIFRQMDKVVVLSKAEEKYWRDLGVNATYIPNPCDKEDGKIFYDKKDYIVWVGRLDLTSKKYLDIIPIMQEVVKEFPDCKLKMFGSGDSGSVEFLQKKIKENNLENNIVYCGYTLDKNEIYAGARVQLSVSVFEAFPMNIYEGKAYGIPLVTYNLPYLELLQEKKGYIAIEQGNIFQAANAIITLLSDKNMEEKMSKEAKESIKKFAEVNIGEQWHQLFVDIDKKLCIENNTEMGKILDTIYGHFQICINEYTTLFEKYSKLKEEYFLQKIKYKVDAENAEIAIYPYGTIGKKIKKILNENQINVSYLVDNYCTDENKGVVNLEYFKKQKPNNIVFIVCSNRRDIYYEIRQPLYTCIEEENIIEIFSEEDIFQKRIRIF